MVGVKTMDWLTALMRVLLPVSYTHLDVYKRQAQRDNDAEQTGEIRRAVQLRSFDPAFGYAGKRRGGRTKTYGIRDMPRRKAPADHFLFHFLGLSLIHI